MKEMFVERKFLGTSLALIEKCDEIVQDYQAQGLRLTLRQLYYQLVSRNIIENKERSYKNLGSLVSDGRLAGLLDWGAIEDRVRVPQVPNEFSGLPELAEAALAAYRLPRWEGQDHYVELWVEKDALAGVLRPLAAEFHVTLMVNRGYSSQSAMYESAKRFDRASNQAYLTLFYLGDHDPSGEDMVRDVRERLRMFGPDVDVVKVALTMAQVQKYRPPPNPAKLTDSRARAYIEKFGPHSWEVDALDPATLATLVRKALRSRVDQDKMDAVVAREGEDKKKLRDAVKSL